MTLFGDGGLVAKLCLTLVTPWTVACQAPLSMGFSRQEHWSRLPFPSPGNFPNPGIKPRSSRIAGRFPTDWAMNKQFQILPMGHVSNQLQVPLFIKYMLNLATKFVQILHMEFYSETNALHFKRPMLATLKHLISNSSHEFFVWWTTVELFSWSMSNKITFHRCSYRIFM